MKFRADFVTNSSSSSFILAQKGELTDVQKDAIVQFVMDNLMGDIVLTPASTEEEIQEFFNDNYIEEEDTQASFRKALAEGKNVRYGTVSFDEPDYSLGNLFESIWTALQNQDPEHFEIIDGDLSY